MILKIIENYINGSLERICLTRLTPTVCVEVTIDKSGHFVHIWIIHQKWTQSDEIGYNWATDLSAPDSLGPGDHWLGVTLHPAGKLGPAKKPVFSILSKAMIIINISSTVILNGHPPGSVEPCKNHFSHKPLYYFI